MWGNGLAGPLYHSEEACERPDCTLPAASYESEKGQSILRISLRSVYLWIAEGIVKEMANFRRRLGLSKDVAKAS